MNIYTIGYATKPITTFTEQLRKYRINAIADIRSVPYSKAFHEYHQENIAAYLKKQNIHYVYLGEELGPRSKEISHYNQHGQVQFNRLMQSALFHKGIDRLIEGLKKGYSIALMCAEKDPATCHRSLLVAHFLVHHLSNTSTFTVSHIDHQGNIEDQTHLEERLVHIHNVSEDLFMSESERLQTAYDQQCKQYAYIKP